MVRYNEMLGSNSITMFHQNICGLKGKTDECLSSMSPNLPHIWCFSEHHFKKFELDQIKIDLYRLGALFCRQAVDGVCIFVQNNLNLAYIDAGKYYTGQAIEVCVLK
jgi:hypothetical protein